MFSIFRLSQRGQRGFMQRDNLPLTRHCSTGRDLTSTVQATIDRTEREITSIRTGKVFRPPLILEGPEITLAADDEKFLDSMLGSLHVILGEILQKGYPDTHHLDKVRSIEDRIISFRKEKLRVIPECRTTAKK